MATQRDNKGNSNNVDNYSRRMAYAETTVEQVREQNEKDLMDIRTVNIHRVKDATIKQQEEIQKFSLKVSKAVNDYQTELLDKYTQKYGAKLEKSAQLQQQLIQQVIKFGKAKQNELRAQEFKSEQDNIFFIKNAKKLADKEIHDYRIAKSKEQQKLDQDIGLQTYTDRINHIESQYQLEKEYLDTLHKDKIIKQEIENKKRDDAFNRYKEEQSTLLDNQLSTEIDAIRYSELGIQNNQEKSKIKQDYDLLPKTSDIKEKQNAYDLEKVKEDTLLQYDLLDKTLANNRHDDALNRIKNEKEVKLKAIQNEKQANKRALQDGSKTFKKYWSDNKKLRDEENKTREKTIEKLKTEGLSDLEIMKETGKLTTGGIKEAVFSKETASTVANNLINGLKNMFEATISTYGSYQSKINTRLQGSGKTWQGNAALGLLGLPTGGIESNLKTAIGSNPYVKLQAVMDNVVKATESGIAYNIEQRAFLATISENIASTFDAFNSNLTRVIRLQQSDTTAARLGLEANLTSLFNSLYQDTSYLNDSFDTVSSNLTEAMSQMSSEEGVAFEYTVQKWLGALSSVGFSSDAISKISQAIGYLGSGDIASLSNNSEMQNLIVMAASRAGMSYSDILIDGLDSSNTNKLMNSMVEYLQEIANSDNKVVKSQYAQIFGMNVSDLKAVNNLSTTIQTISSTMLDYGGAMAELYDQVGQLGSRVSMAGMLTNLMENVKYSIGTNIVSNPATYALWEVTSMIEDLTGGINLPTISAFGNSVDLNTTVTNLMRAGIVGVSTLGSIGSIISGIGSTFAPSSMLSKLGIENSTSASKTQLARGVGFNRKTRQLNEVSSSTMVGNASGDDYYKSTIASANEQTATTAETAKEESTDKTTNDIYDYLITIFDPKFTEVEKLLATAYGYSFNTSGNNKFKSTDESVSASTITIRYESQDGKERANTVDILTNINKNVAEILTQVTEINRKSIDNSVLNITAGGNGLI